MEQLHRIGEDVYENSADIALGGFVFAVQPGLCHLDIPVAELRPNKAVYPIDCKVEVERIDVSGGVDNNFVEPVQYPLVGDVKHIHVNIADGLIAKVHHDEP